MIYFLSDTHFFHKNICRGVSKWNETRDEGHQKTRDFDTVDQMNEQIYKAINDKVKYNDTIYHLGDWSFDGVDKIEKSRERINCNNIHLIFGNHDQHITPVDSEYRKLFTSSDYYKEINITNGKNPENMICMFHYATRIWNKRHKGSIFLYGHSHNTLPNAGDKSMDVGVDTNKDYSPYSLDEILSIMKNKSNNPIDHHNLKTN